MADSSAFGSVHAGALSVSAVEAEQRHLATVVREIDARLERVGRERRGHAEALVEMRREFWQDMKLQAEAIDAAADLDQERIVLSHRQRQHDSAAAEAALLPRQRRSPYFGRIDVSLDGPDDGAPEPLTLYIGLASFRAEDGTTRVYDWRAPVSSLYYDAVPGPVAYEAPMGTVRGQMLLKRQFEIRDSQLVTVVDSDVTLGDPLLMETLGRHSDTAMRGIVATIQAEQNRAIRDLDHPLVIVLGSAGSGKTSVALQRVAFLLYRQRDSLDADQVVLFSPNPLFSSYVAAVLPELGERNMRQVTFQEYLEHRLGAELRVESAYGQLEALLAARPSAALTARREAIAYKASQAFLDAIGRFADGLGREGMRFRAVRHRGRVIASPAALAALFDESAPAAALATRVQRMREGLDRRLRTYGRRETREAWPEEALELVDSDTRQAVFEHLDRDPDEPSGAEYYRRERALMTRAIVDQSLEGVRAAIEEMRFVDTVGLYLDLLEAVGSLAPQPPPATWHQATAATRAALGRGELPYEDATPLLYLTELVRGRHASVGVRHVLVDEAQDYSHCQLDFLRRAFPFARFTLLGDPDQAVLPGGGAIADTAAVARAYAPGEVAVLRLGRSYRPTRPIAEFTRGLSAGGAQVEPVDRPGTLPVLALVPTVKDLPRATARAVHGLLAEGCESVAVLTKTAQDAARVAADLPADLGALLLTARSTALQRGVLVLPAYLAKGLEFDGVVVHHASAATYPSEGERALLYAACTRAMHGLRLVAVERLSPLLEALDKDTYHLET